MRIREPERLDVLVNKEMWLPKEYIPENLVQPKINFLPDTNPEAMFLRKDIVKSLEKLFKKAKKEKNVLYGVSGYRSYKRQSEIFKNNLKKDGFLANKYSARPGQSEHQTGLAIDITCEEVNFMLSDEFQNTKEYEWLADNVHKYGFIIRYLKGKEDITGYAFEPWHLRYVGEELAEKLYLTGWSLEEYFEEKTVKKHLFFLI